MDGPISNNKIEYIFRHLGHHAEIDSEIKAHIKVGGSLVESSKPYIYFPLSTGKLDEIKIIGNTPVLFPLSENRFHFEVLEKNVIFSDDLLKSAFYLLSGYQETLPFDGDVHGRFLYNDSIQKQLSIAERPLVNEYFSIIIEGIKTFCNLNGIKFTTKSLWEDKDFGFLLTHDVDRVDKYTVREIKLRLKQLAGFSASKVNKKELTKLLFQSIYGYFSGDNPYWNFDWMKSIEKKCGFNSVWFFLPQGDPNKDAYYSFYEPRIKQLVKFLIDSGDEIGLHGTFESGTNEKLMQQNYDSVNKLIGHNPLGNRQHWLRIKYPDTLRILENIGIKYDSSWGFTDHIGWRNSYCHPFEPYDIDKDRMMNIWELPLAVMDVSLFEYQNLKVDEALNSIEKILKIVEKYNGLFTLLWHNSYFELTTGKDLTEFYKTLIQMIVKRNMFSLLPNSTFFKKVNK